MSASKTGRVRSQKARVYRALRQDILTLALPPGRMLVESQLARRFRVSKTPVREALALLDQEGLVEIMPRRGILVTAITVRDVREMFELRMALEGAAAQLAAARITTTEFEHLEALIRHSREALADAPAVRPGDRKVLKRLLDTNREFHLTIARASGNARLVRLVERTLDDMMRLIAIGYEIGEHVEILAALRTGDGEQARAMMVNHVRTTLESVLKREVAQDTPFHNRSHGHALPDRRTT
jgi:DNA-binding GntR family transcriptional regulator